METAFESDELENEDVSFIDILSNICFVHSN